MKKVILLALLMPFPAFGQVLENFESGSIINWVQSTEGRWKADTSESLSGSFSLHHIFDNPDAGTDVIGMPDNNLHLSEGLTRWSFLIRYGYDPSSSNNWSVFLMSDTRPSDMIPDGSTNGYAVGVNLAGYDDTLRLWKVKGSILTPVINCGINWQTDIGISNAVKIVVERTPSGNWMVIVLRLNGDLIGSNSGADNELLDPSWFLIYYRYSSTRDRLLWLDDLKIEGVFYEDRKAPEVVNCVASGRNKAEITFNEEPDAGSMIPENFSLNAGENKPVSVKMKTPLTYVIEFTSSFENRSQNNIIIDLLCDRSANCIQNINVPFNPVWVSQGDLIISEIMADPLPEVSLPGREYIEISNRTDYTFNLKNWKLSSDSQSAIFPAIDIKPSGILIICSSKDTLLFSKYGKVTGLKQFPALTIGGSLICLSDSSGNLIHGVEYSSGWYGDELKSNGGWSLEMIDTQFPFYYEENWTASSSRIGGTPGSVNSVRRSNQDITFSGIQNVFPVDSNNLIVRFSEPVPDLSFLTKSIKIGGEEIIDLHATDPLFREFNVQLVPPLLKGKDYQLDITKEIKDFAGNIMEKRSFIFRLPEPAEKGDVLFNELLFNPFQGDPDYIELYNCSDKAIDASRLQLISVNDGTGDTTQIYTLSLEKRCIMPDSYYAVTIDKKKITGRYFSSDPEFLFETGSLPAMSDNEGHLVLFNRELDKIDEVFYNENMHYSLLSGNEGVALEKTGIRNSSLEAVNWHSASESSGWGTPGAPNSVFVGLAATEDKVVFSSSKISPDNDGNEDILSIHFSLTGNNDVVSVTVFDETGSFVRKIAENLLIGPDASIIWDGTAADGSPVRTGIYIIFISLFDDTGKTEKWKKVCTVIRK
jgi:hypothetical protein